MKVTDTNVLRNHNKRYNNKLYQTGIHLEKCDFRSHKLVSNVCSRISEAFILRHFKVYSPQINSNMCVQCLRRAISRGINA